MGHSFPFCSNNKQTYESEEAVRYWKSLFPWAIAVGICCRRTRLLFLFFCLALFSHPSFFCPFSPGHMQLADIHVAVKIDASYRSLLLFPCFRACKRGEIECAEKEACFVSLHLLAMLSVIRKLIQCKKLESGRLSSSVNKMPCVRDRHDFCQYLLAYHTSIPALMQSKRSVLMHKTEVWCVQITKTSEICNWNRHAKRKW